MNQRKNYASELTKDYLISLGFTDITPDGYHVYWKGKELAQYIPKSKNPKKQYLQVGFYSTEIYENTPKEERTRATGTVTFKVHVLNYVWNRGNRGEGLVVDHIDNNSLNNHIDNLQLLTQAENLEKERGVSTKQLKCKLDRPFSYYIDKLDKYLAQYEEAKKAHDADLCHKLRTNIANIRAKIRYYEAHLKETEEIQTEKAAIENKKRAYHKKADTIKELKAKIKNAHRYYKEALEAYGPDDFEVLKLKHEWKIACYNLNQYLFEQKLTLYEFSSDENKQNYNR